jgi:hypothetical protein
VLAVRPDLVAIADVAHLAPPVAAPIAEPGVTS